VSAPFRTPPAVDLLDQAMAYVRPYLDPSIPVCVRVRTLWAAVVAARDLATSDVIEAEFMRFARETGLVCDLGHHAADDLRHVIRWAMLNRKPFA
jgi:hypothetical protein